MCNCQECRERLRVIHEGLEAGAELEWEAIEAAIDDLESLAVPED